jgi:hypothetical protein
MRIACWINKCTDTHSEYVMQEWLHEGATALHVHCVFSVYQCRTSKSSPFVIIVEFDLKFRFTLQPAIAGISTGTRLVLPAHARNISNPSGLSPLQVCVVFDCINTRPQ